jgi:hypothetical protein
MSESRPQLAYIQQETLENTAVPFDVPSDPLPTVNAKTHAPQFRNMDASTRNVQDLPEDINELPEPGYPKLANMMGSRPSMAIFRRFRTLSMLNLLRLQAELHDLEHQLFVIIKEDMASKDKVREAYSSDFRLMRDWVHAGDSEQFDQLKKIAKTLETYGSSPKSVL